jgi:hypothetical protein
MTSEIALPEMDGAVNMTFETVGDMNKAIIEIIGKIQESDNPKMIINQFCHLWWSLVKSEKDHTDFNNVTEHNNTHYYLSRGNTPADILISRFYEARDNIRVKLGVDCAADCDTIVAGDYVIQAYMPDDIKKMVDEVYENFHSMSEDELKKFYEDIMIRKTNINMVINKNSDIASKIREKTLKNFGE